MRGTRSGRRRSKSPPPPAAAPTGAIGDEGIHDDEPPVRYDVGDLIGHGAQGLVYRAVDRDLSRAVAMKVLRPELAKSAHQLEQFQAEARRTASLAHAGIPAVHELGRTSTGEPYFTMRLVTGRTLHDALNDLREGDAGAAARYTLTKLVQILQRVANTLEYAHERGLVHRDLKPGNIALSEHDEVLVLDWGLSKRVTSGPDDTVAAMTGHPGRTVHGQVKGTPLYMSPEQARGEVTQIEPRTDVFALGAILYEILSLSPPYGGKTTPEVVREARRGKIVPPAERAPAGRDVPKALAETAMRALAKDPGQRQASAVAFADELQAWLDGSRERDARRREADGLLRLALQVARRSEEYRGRAAAAEAEAARLRLELAPWAAADAKAALWAHEDAAVAARAKSAEADARAVELAVQALAHVPGDATGRELLARTHLRWYREALERNDPVSSAMHLKMARYYNDGWLDAALREEARLSVAAESEGAVVTLYRCAEQARRLVASEQVGTLTAPAVWESLPPGRYVAMVRHAGGGTAPLPILLRAGANRTFVMPDPVFDPPPPGFLVVPAGPFLTGAGPALTDVHVDTFWIARTPVLLTEYALWLDELFEEDRDAPSAHIPWLPTHGALLHRAGDRFVFCPGAPMAERPLKPHEDLPVVGVSRASARSYAQWVGERLGRSGDLPTELQWEKAARGPDGRLYPWGDRFDPTFCSMANSTQEAAELRPACAFPADMSPYGVRDMAGNTREWTRDDDPGDPRAAIARGGGWSSSESECRVTSRWVLDPSTQSASIGFRIVIE